MRLTDPTLLCPHYCQSPEIVLCSEELNLVLLMLTIGLLVLQGSSRQPQQDFKMVLYVQRRHRQVMHSVIELSDVVSMRRILSYIARVKLPFQRCHFTSILSFYFYQTIPPHLHYVVHEELLIVCFVACNSGRRSFIPFKGPKNQMGGLCSKCS